MPVSNAAAWALAADYVDRLVVRTVRDVHRAVSSRAFRATGPVSAPVRVLHNGISGMVYGVIGAGARAAGAVLRSVEDGSDFEAASGGRQVSAAVNGLVGEALDDTGHPMAIQLAARQDGRDVQDLGAAYPGATRDVVLFLHGLCENEECWELDAETSGGSYADRLAAETPWTPVPMRYNTGLRIARNGELLAAWLDHLVDSWPVRVRSIGLVGHSMGGLVALAAGRAGGSWTPRLRHVVCLGSPHLGAPLEQAVHWGSRGLAAFPESLPFSTILDTRSAGIVDLGRGDPVCVPLAGASYHCISGSIRGPLGPVVGDWMVRRSSATGRIAGATARHLPGTNHYRLLNHPEVYADLRRLLTSDPVIANS